MKEKFERFKNEKIVVNVRSQKQYDDFMKMCEKQGLQRDDWNLPTKNNVYNNYKENTCINVNNLTRLSYSTTDFYKNYGYKIITYKDFMKKSRQFTKSDLKDNHIVKTQSGRKYMWRNYSLKNYLTECLEDAYYYDDIVKVYEFETLVWKREEKPVEILDEVEKRWLNHFIKSTNIKVKYIVKYDVSYYNDMERLGVYYNIGAGIESTMLPYFKEDTMYKGMELNKEYTLKELGLED